MTTVVCKKKPNRKNKRYFTINDLIRIMRKVLNQNNSSEDIFAAMMIATENRDYYVRLNDDLKKVIEVIRVINVIHNSAQDLIDTLEAAIIGLNRFGKYIPFISYYTRTITLTFALLIALLAPFLAIGIDDTYIIDFQARLATAINLSA
jgi:hypothetical protein